MVCPRPAGVAWRRVARAAISSVTKLATEGPANTRHVNCLVATRPLCSVRSFSGDRPSGTTATATATVPIIQTSPATSMASALCRLTIQPNSGPRRPLSSLPPPSGEPITYLSLNNLADNPGAVKRARRVGRGIGSSKGKTCGRGHKGQKARAGKGVHPTFEGGQTRFFKRLPKIGKMKNARFRLELVSLNLGKVQDYVTMGRLVPERGDGVLTMRDFVNAGMFPASSVKSGVKLLADGSNRLKDRLLIDVPWASAAAIEAVESKGGFVTTVHYNRLALRAHLKPHKFPLKPEAMLAQQGNGEGAAAATGLDVEDMYLLPKRARPPVKYMPYYTDYAKRGYLSPQVQLERKKRGLKEIH